jgi:hypothetical protein
MFGVKNKDDKGKAIQAYRKYISLPGSKIQKLKFPVYTSTI